MIKKIFKKDELKLLWPFYIHTALINLFALVGLFWIIYFNQQGFSFRVISIGMAIMGISGFLFEVPTGAIADVFGRKFSLVLGESILATIFFMVPFVNNSYTLWAVFFLWGIGGSLWTGADEAWIVDYLKSKKKKNLIREYYIKEEFIASLAFVFAGLIAAFIVKNYNMNLLWFIEGTITLFGIFFLIKQKEYFKERKVNLSKSFSDSFKSAKKGLSFSLKHPVVFYLILGMAFVAAALELSGLGWQPYILSTGFKLHYLGYLGAAASAVNIFAPFLSKFLIKKIKYERYYLAFTNFIVAAVFISFFYLMSPIVAGLTFIFIGMKYGLERPVMNPYFQKFVPSKIRATVGSLQGAARSIGWIVGDIVAILFMDSLGVQNIMGIAGILLLPAIFFFFKAKKPEKEK
tara:strand:+ start:11244 stop:12458 length:1215 start_codon:yes stop_codon:yes gene_type:complete